MDRRNGNNDIYGYDIYQDKEFLICEKPEDQNHPVIYGNIVVWEDFRNRDWDIYGYDLIKQTEFAVCTDQGPQHWPGIFYDVIVWEDYRDDSKGDIYGYDLSTDMVFAICSIPHAQLWPGVAYFQVTPEIRRIVVVWYDKGGKDMDIYGAIIEPYLLAK